MTLSKTLKISCILILTNAATAFGQFHTDYDGLFKVGARSSAMGGAIISDGRDAAMMFHNPAALTALQSGSVFIDHSARAGHRHMTQTVGFVVPTGKEGSFAMALSTSHQGQLYSQPNGDNFKAQNYSLYLGQSVFVAQSFSAGVLARTQVIKSEEIQVLDLTTVLGLHYAPSPEITYAITLSNLGLRKALKLETVEDIKLETRPAALAIGMSMRFPSSYDRQDFTLALTNEKQFGTAGLTYRFGIEYYPVAILALRVGAVTGPFDHGARIGMGLRSQRFLLDVAYAPGDSDGQYQISTFIDW